MFVDYQTFDLMEGRRMGCIYFVRTEYTSRCDHTNRQFPFFHGSRLNRRSLGTKQNAVCDKESILFVTSRMIFRNIQFGEVVICILNFRSFHNFITHTDKNSFYFFQCNGIRMTMTNVCFFCRQCDIDYFCCHLCFPQFFLQTGFCLLHHSFNFCPGFIHHLSYFRTIFRSYILHTFQHRSKLSFFTKEIYSYIIQFVQGV